MTSPSKPEKYGAKEVVGQFVKDQVTTIDSLAPTAARNVAMNYPRLKGLLMRRNCNALPDEIPDYWSKKTPAIVTASGPSLTEILPHLNEMRDAMGAPIFAAIQQSEALVRNGVDPDYIIATDPREGLSKYIPKDVPDRSVFILHPGIHPEVFRVAWKSFQKSGLLFRPLMMTNFMPYRLDETVEEWYGRIENKQSFMGGLVRGYMEHVRGPLTEALYGKSNPDLRYPITTHIYSQPCAPLMQCAFAYSMGYNPILFCGFDLGYRDGASRVDTWFDGKKVEVDRPHKMIIEGYKFPTTYEMIDYKISTMLMARKVWPLDMVEVIGDMGPGNLEFLPTMHYKDLMVPWPEGKRPGKPSSGILQQYFEHHGLKIVAVE